jgi:predicted membrane chloride channel (bestrophin family)
MGTVEKVTDKPWVMPDAATQARNLERERDAQQSCMASDLRDVVRALDEAADEVWEYLKTETNDHLRDLSGPEAAILRFIGVFQQQLEMAFHILEMDAKEGDEGEGDKDEK